MYAHQVIEDILKYKVIYGDDAGDFFLKNINLSQKFHMGDIEPLPLSQSSAHEIKPLAKVYAKLPYKVCWFDYRRQGEETGRPVKAGFLMQQIENVCWIFSFAKTQEAHQWLGGVYWKVEENIVEPKAYLLNSMSSAMPDQLGHQIINDAYYMFLDAWVFLILLNCKNIETEKLTAPTKLNKKRGLKGLTEIFDYHVLKIKVPGKSGASTTANGNHNRLHLCRGHFKEFTKEKPLFGKFDGLYWWDAHVRGQNQKGIVMKDYTLVASA